MQTDIFLNTGNNRFGGLQAGDIIQKQKRTNYNENRQKSYELKREYDLKSKETRQGLGKALSVGKACIGITRNTHGAKSAMHSCGKCKVWS